MNPFQLSPSPPQSHSFDPPDEDASTIRTMRLIDDLRLLSNALDVGAWASVTIVQSPERLQVATYEEGVNITPLLAAALLADLERQVAAGEVVRSRLPDEWRRRLLGHPS